MEFKNCTAKAHLFFDMLPKDWQDAIVPFWEDLKATTQLLVLVEHEVVVAGGLVFSKCPPDMLYYENEAKKWFKKGYLYLGFIFVDETKRNRNLGSLWLDNIKKLYPNTGFWLAIEDENLHKFYDRNGFEKVATIKNEDLLEESIYAFKP
ncbi:MAG TPA: GNAT family N-acetyltransferase [Flavobacteriaceae bacterium]